MCFSIMHIVSKFQFFIHIFAVVKLKKTNKKFERGKKREKWAKLLKNYKIYIILYLYIINIIWYIHLYLVER